MNIVINQKEYIFKKGIRDDHKIRKSFNHLAKQSFGFDFEAWYQLGFWNDKYIPYVRQGNCDAMYLFAMIV